MPNQNFNAKLTLQSILGIQKLKAFSHPLFIYCRDKIAVSPFGFDSITWDPSIDNFLPENFSVDDMEGKTSCKVALQQYVGLSENDSKIIVSLIPGLIMKVIA